MSIVKSPTRTNAKLLLLKRKSQPFCSQVFLKLDVLRRFRDQPFGSANHQHFKLSTNHVTSLVGYIGTLRLSTKCAFCIRCSVSEGSSLFSCSGVNPAAIHGPKWCLLHTISVKLMPSDIVSEGAAKIMARHCHFRIKPWHPQRPTRPP